MCADENNVKKKKRTYTRPSSISVTVSLITEKLLSHLI